MSRVIELRQTLEADIEVFFEHQRDPEATEMAGFFPRDRAAFASHWSKIFPDTATEKQTALVDGDIAGFIVSFVRNDVRQVGYWFGREFWGGGVATRALTLFLESYKVRPLYGYVAQHNKGSVRVLEKCGFQMNGECVAPATARGPETREYVLRLDDNPL